MDSMIALVNIISTFINPFKFYYSGHYDIHLAFQCVNGLQLDNFQRQKYT